MYLLYIYPINTGDFPLSFHCFRGCNQLRSQASEEKRMPDRASWQPKVCFFFSGGGGGVCFLFVLATPHPHLWYRIHLNVCRALKRSCVAIRADASPTVRRFQQENPVILQFFPHWLESPCNHLYTYAAYAFWES